jgi:thiol-disulfide isomerase/thioredoxin
MKSLSFIFSFALVANSIQASGPADTSTADTTAHASPPVVTPALPAAGASDADAAAKQEEISRQEMQRFKELKAAVAAKCKGKVVLADFWATWCGPCVAELPHVKEAYEKFHSQGLQVVGISFDNDKAALENFVKSRDLARPQYYDGQGWQNKFGQRYAIRSIPTMWLLDRNGDVADTEARQGLEGKIKKLLEAGATPHS